MSFTPSTGERLLARSRLVFDAGPLLLYFADDGRVVEMMDGVASGSVDGYTSDLNMAELYYKTCETFGREVADLRHMSFRRSALRVVATDEGLTRAAGRLKCVCRGKISLADAYVIAVAQRVKGTLVTTDHILEELGVVETRTLKIL